MSSRKIWDGSQWKQIGGSVNDVVPITQADYDALPTPDASTMYVITDSTGAAVAAQSFRVNQRLIQKIMVGGNQLWQPVVFATGGIITDIDLGGVLWRIHTFTSSGQFEVLQDDLDIEYLVVAGGGGGGVPSGYSGGGGGGGGLIEGATTMTVSVNNITVGNGGAVASQGQDSSIGSSIISIGGGAGGSGTTGTGGSGGSGGGGTYNLGTAGSATSGQGNSGGAGGASAGISGGGGGAGRAGSNSGQGGSGYGSSITGTTQYYAGGGGGGRSSSSTGSPGGGGIGGGGAGGKGSAAVAGTPNSGGGGGGGGTAAAGGSGVVVIRYQIG